MIEKKIHYCWFGGAPLPERDKKCIESWKKFCPDYEIIEWNETNYDINKCKYMQQAYEKGKWGFVPDYARLDIIYNEGGIYLDTDVEIIKSWDELLQYKVFFGFESNQNVACGLGFGAEKGNELIKKMRDYYDDLLFVKDDGTLNLVASPYYNTLVLKEIGVCMDGCEQDIDGVHIFPPECFAPLSYADNKLNVTDATYSIHWYNASWHTPVQRRMNKRKQIINRLFGIKIGKYVNKLFNGWSRITKIKI